MKKLFIITSLLFLCNFLFAENDTNSISKEGLRLQIQEFAYPFIPDAGKLTIEVPLSLFMMMKYFLGLVQGFGILPLLLFLFQIHF
jgi:hypothetical protein